MGFEETLHADQLVMSAWGGKGERGCECGGACAITSHAAPSRATLRHIVSPRAITRHHAPSRACVRKAITCHLMSADM